jgi:hypothetical protein
MGVKDNKCYIKVRTELAKIYRPDKYDTLHNNLITIGYDTEDRTLKKLINTYCNMICDVQITVKQRKCGDPEYCYAGKIINNTTSAKSELDDYCMKIIASGKPEWQVIAENHGWTPPK